jgi:hypothetical protein
MANGGFELPPTWLPLRGEDEADWKVRIGLAEGCPCARPPQQVRYSLRSVVLRRASASPSLTDEAPPLHSRRKRAPDRCCRRQ